MTVQLDTTRVGGDGNVVGTRVYTTRFTPEIVHSALKYKCGEFRNQRRGHYFSLVKPGAHVSAGATSLEEFLYSDFNETFEKHTTPPKPTTQVDIDRNFERMAKNIADALKKTRTDEDKDKEGKPYR